jgi:MFS family permease
MSSAITPEDITELADADASPADIFTKEQRPLRIEFPVKVVIASSFVLRLAGAMTAILLSSFLKQRLDDGSGNTNTALIGTLYALFYVTEFTLSPLFGALSDLRGRRLILVLGPLLGVIALPIYPLSAAFSIFWITVVILGIARLLEGISTAAKVPDVRGDLPYRRGHRHHTGRAPVGLAARMGLLHSVRGVYGGGGDALLLRA